MSVLISKVLNPAEDHCLPWRGHIMIHFPHSYFPHPLSLYLCLSPVHFFVLFCLPLPILWSICPPFQFITWHHLMWLQEPVICVTQHSKHHSRIQGHSFHYNSWLKFLSTVTRGLFPLPVSTQNWLNCLLNVWMNWLFFDTCHIIIARNSKKKVIVDFKCWQNYNFLSLFWLIFFIQVCNVFTATNVCSVRTGCREMYEQMIFCLLKCWNDHDHEIKLDFAYYFWFF